MKTLKRTILVGLMLCFCSTLRAQMESSLSFRRYTTQDGLPQMQTERVWQDSRGYIYIGTLSGFVRFDGRTFTPFLKGRRENIVGFIEVEDQVSALSFRRQWIVDWDKTKAQPYDAEGKWLLNNLNAGDLPEGYVLMEDEHEQHRRLCRMTKQGLEPVVTDEHLDEMTPDRTLYVDEEQGIVMIPTETGLYRIEKGKPAERISEKADIYTLLQTDSALLAFSADGICASAEEILRVGGPAIVWPRSSYGLTVRKFRSGEVVIADEHTVYVYDGREVRPILTGINLIRDVLVDCWDRLWVASYQGVYCLFNRCFTNYRLTDREDIVRAVVADGEDQLLMGTLNGKLLADSLTVSDDPAQFYAPSAVRIGKKVYMAGNGDVVCLMKQEDGTYTQEWLGLPHSRYQFVAQAGERLIIGSRQMVTAYDPQSQTFDTLTTEIMHPWCAAADSKGRLWVGSSPGLYCITSEGQVSKMEYSQKLIISTMDADSLGRVFFASADSLFLIQDGEIKNLNSQIPHLASHEVRSLHVSPYGYLVVAVVDGLFVARLSQDNQISGVHFFDHHNGFTMLEPLKAKMAEMSDGTVWLPGVEEMTAFRPSDLLAHDEEDTYITPPLRWWQHWWVRLLGVLLLAGAVWVVTGSYEKMRQRRRMIRLEQEKLWKQQQIEEIRRIAIEDSTTKLAHDIVKMTEKTENERFTFRTASGTIIVEASDIAFFKGEGNYSQIVTFHDKDLILVGLGALEKMLNPETFVRADRSTLVNIHYVCQLLPRQHRCLFRSTSGQEVETTLLTPAFKRLQALL